MAKGKTFRRYEYRVAAGPGVGRPGAPGPPHPDPRPRFRGVLAAEAADGALPAAVDPLARERVGAGRRHELLGHPVVDDWVKQAADKLSPALMLTITWFDPDCVVIGGTCPAYLSEAIIARMQLEQYWEDSAQRKRLSATNSC